MMEYPDYEVELRKLLRAITKQDHNDSLIGSDYNALLNQYFLTRRPKNKDGDLVYLGQCLYGADGRCWEIVEIGKCGLHGAYDVMGRCSTSRQPLKAKWLSKEIDVSRDAVLAAMERHIDKPHQFKIIKEDIDRLVRSGRWFENAKKQFCVLGRNTR